MEEYNSTENKNIETVQKLDGDYKKTTASYRKPLTTLFKKILSFICYGPGVFGFLWLIGRILKR